MKKVYYEDLQRTAHSLKTRLSSSKNNLAPPRGLEPRTFILQITLSLLKGPDYLIPDLVGIRYIVSTHFDVPDGTSFSSGLSCPVPYGAGREFPELARFFITHFCVKLP